MREQDRVKDGDKVNRQSTQLKPTGECKDVNNLWMFIVISSTTRCFHL